MSLGTKLEIEVRKLISVNVVFWTFSLEKLEIEPFLTRQNYEGLIRPAAHLTFKPYGLCRGV